MFSLFVSSLKHSQNKSALVESKFRKKKTNFTKYSVHSSWILAIAVFSDQKIFLSC